RPHSYVLHSTISRVSFSLSSSLAHPALHSFPTRRSSDLGLPLLAATLGGACFTREEYGRQGIGEDVYLATMLCLPRFLRETYEIDRKSTRLNSSHVSISYAVFCLKKKKKSKTD